MIIQKMIYYYINIESIQTKKNPNYDKGENMIKFCNMYFS